jgi:hypothetical protein
MIEDSAAMVMVRLSRLLNKEYEAANLDDLNKYELYHVRGAVKYDIEGFSERVVYLLQNFEGRLRDHEKKFLTNLYDKCLKDLNKTVEYLNSLLEGIALTEKLKRGE